MSDDVARVKKPRWQAWLRVCVPLLLWCVLALILAGLQLRRHLLQRTRLHGSVSFNIKGEEQPFEVLLDSKPFRFGEQVSLGYHTLSVTAAKAVRLQTNFHSWYGKRDLGKITLNRALGTMVISAEPPAPKLIIKGAEFSTVLTNCAGFTSSVPTGDYVVEGLHKYWRYEDSVLIVADKTTVQKIAPRFGSLAIAGSHPGIQFKLWDDESRLIEAGTLPAILNDLPVGGYHLDTERNGDTQKVEVSVQEKTTNAVNVEFTYGSVTIESTPIGATVIKDGRELGITPLHLGEVKPGPFEFSLRLNEYEVVSGALTIVANETNGFRTNLISQHYTRAMTAARRLLANGDYERAANAAAEALAHQAGDTDALTLRRDAAYKGYITKAEGFAQRGIFTNAISEVKAALSISPDDAQAKQLLADYSKREQERLDIIRRREAERAERERLRREQERMVALARARIEELRKATAAVSRSYENANMFEVNEVSLSNQVAIAGADVSRALSTEPPVFENVRLNWIQPHLFKIEARQRVGVGYRDCLILGTQVSGGEVRIEFKVFEYEHPPDVKLLGGLVQVSADFKNTSQDPKVVAERAEKFRQRVKDGVKLVEVRIQKVMGHLP